MDGLGNEGKMPSLLATCCLRLALGYVRCSNMDMGTPQNVLLPVLNCICR